MRIRVALSAAVVGLLVGVTASAQASFPGGNGQLVYEPMYNQPAASIGTTAPTNTTPDNVYGFIPTGSVQGPRNIAWSPDGLRLAFDGPATSLGTGRALYVMNGDGTGLAQVGRGNLLRYNPAWSPDGNTLAFVQDNGPDGSGDIYTITTNGGSLTRLTTNPAWDGSPDWSPDGTRIAYVCRSGGRAQVCQMAPDGSDKTVTTAGLPLPGGVLQLSWSPDSANIAFSVGDAGETARGIYRASRHGTSLRPMYSPPECCELRSSVAWSPDGARIAFDLINGGEGGILTVSAVDGTDAKQIIGNDDWFTLDAGGWQPWPPAPPRALQPGSPQPSQPQTQTPSTTQPTVVVLSGQSRVVRSLPSSPGQRTVSRRQARRTTKSALRLVYRKKFGNGDRYRASCRRKSPTRWTCRVSWRYKVSRYRGTVIVRFRPGTGYSTTVQVRRPR